MSDQHTGLEKAPTGIAGLDEITYGGLPKGRPTLIAGSAGSGKTMFGMQFLVSGATRYGEPGVFVAFEEDEPELVQNFQSLGIDLRELAERGLLSLDHVRVQRSEFEETGEYDLDGLFIRLGYAIDQIGAKRVVLDTIETLFGGLPNPAILRAELHRLFEWLRNKGVTAIVTGESGSDSVITRQGLEEYVSDCVIVLNQRVVEDISTRRVRVVKYRGSAHGTNEYPFLIDERGISVLPITSLEMTYGVSDERVSSGIPALDEMIEGGGFFRGSSILVSGTAGTGKSSVAAHFVSAACSRGEKALYISFEESAPQHVRNMASIGLDLNKWVDAGLLRYEATRSTLYGLEMHLVNIHNILEEFQPDVVVIDPMTSLQLVGTQREIQSTLARLVDLLKSRGITGLFVSLISGGDAMDRTEESVSSLMDSWLLLRNVEYAGERNRTLYLLKSRGMAHSNQVREFVLTDEGVKLERAYVGPGGVFTGSARVAQEAADEAERTLRQQEIEARQRDIARKREALEARVLELRAEYDADEAEATRVIEELKLRDTSLATERASMQRRRTSTSTSDVETGE